MADVPAGDIPDEVAAALGARWTGLVCRAASPHVVSLPGTRQPGPLSAWLISPGSPTASPASPTLP
jgi:hypothetical protein